LYLCLIANTVSCIVFSWLEHLPPYFDLVLRQDIFPLLSIQLMHWLYRPDLLHFEHGFGQSLSASTEIGASGLELPFHLDDLLDQPCAPLEHTNTAMTSLPY